MFEIYGIKSTPIIHSFTSRNFILLTYEKVVIKYVWLPSIRGLKFTVWKFIPNSSTIYSAIYIRYFLFSYLNSWNSHATRLTVHEVDVLRGGGLLSADLSSGVSLRLWGRRLFCSQLLGSTTFLKMYYRRCLCCCSANSQWQGFLWRYAAVGWVIV